MRNIAVALFSLFIISFLCSTNNHVYAEERNQEIKRVLHSAEQYFTSLKNGRYQSAWSTLSEKSQRKIIDEVYRASQDDGVTITREEIVENFDRGGIIFQSYWKAVSNIFDPNMVLEKSVWKMGLLQTDRAVISIHYKEAPQPTKLKMFKEQNEWRVGFMETFETTKAQKLPQYIFDKFN